MSIVAPLAPAVVARNLARVHAPPPSAALSRGDGASAGRLVEVDGANDAAPADARSVVEVVADAIARALLGGRAQGAAGGVDALGEGGACSSSDRGWGALLEELRGDEVAWQKLLASVRDVRQVHRTAKSKQPRASEAVEQPELLAEVEHDDEKRRLAEARRAWIHG